DAIPHAGRRYQRRRTRSNTSCGVADSGRIRTEGDRMIPGTVAIVVALLAQSRVEPQELNLTRALGYGAGIHHFKNYVLRGADDYRTKADESLGEAEKILASLRVAPDATPKDKEAVDAIEKVVKQYRANLPVAQKMHAEGKSIQEIDTAVKVDDAPAVAGLAVLRARPLRGS